MFRVVRPTASHPYGTTKGSSLCEHVPVTFHSVERLAAATSRRPWWSVCLSVSFPLGKLATFFFCMESESEPSLQSS